MLTALMVLLRSLGLICGGHRAVVLENLALRQQLAVLTRTVKRPQLRSLRTTRCLTRLGPTCRRRNRAVMSVGASARRGRACASHIDSNAILFVMGIARRGIRRRALTVLRSMDGILANDSAERAAP